MDFLEDKIADRLGGRQFGKSTQIYKFERIKRAKAEARRRRPELPLLDMGVGEPDKSAAAGIVEVLAEEAGRPENRWYADNGIPEFQEAAAGYLADIYRVQGIDPSTQIVHGIGSKPMLAMLPLCLINPGDITLSTTPGYPVTGTYTRYVGGEVYNLPLHEENGFFPDFAAIPTDILRRAKLLYINYPNNPTGQVATDEFFREVVEFARQHQVVVVHDAAYAAIVFDDSEPYSFLSVDGAVEVGVEIHSLSKAFNMTGWRIAFIAGNSKAVQAYATVKDNTDSGQFRAIQKAGIHALAHPEITLENCRRYSRRFDLLVETLRKVGFDAQKPGGTFYCYVRAPRGTTSGLEFGSAEEASEFLIKEALISTVPWDDAGAYLRFSVTFEADGVEEERAVVQELERRLADQELVF
jgi:LL-diaminopimelate aminotransferase